MVGYLGEISAFNFPNAIGGGLVLLFSHLTTVCGEIPTRLANSRWGRFSDNLNNFASWPVMSSSLPIIHPGIISGVWPPIQEYPNDFTRVEHNFLGQFNRGI